MNPERIKNLLEQVRLREISVEEALLSLKDLPFEELGVARLDHHRELRTGIPEIVLGEGKSAAHLLAIVRRLAERNSLAIVSRLDSEKGCLLSREFPGGRYHSEARIFSFGTVEANGAGRGKLAVVAAGTSDIAVAEEAAVTAGLLGNEVDRIYDVGVAGLQRLLAEVGRLRESSVLIVAAGMEGALPSVVAGLVGRPIVAVPTSVGYGTGLGGVAALMTMLNSCAPGVTVVNIDNGVGAAVAAHLMNRP